MPICTSWEEGSGDRADRAIAGHVQIVDRRRERLMELRHLETLLAISEEGSFTAAADALNTVQSNVSDQIRQLERELGVPLLVRGRRGAEPTEFGEVVLDRARRVQRELEAMRADLSMIQGLEAGHARLGIVGTASRWLMPALVADLHTRAPGVRLRVNEAASERLFAEVIAGELAQAVVTQPVDDRRLVVDHLLDEALLALVHADTALPREPVPLAALAKLPLVLPPESNPLRIELDAAAAKQDLRLNVVVEIEGIRLIADMVAAGDYASILPETAMPPDLGALRAVTIARMPPRRLAIVHARDVQLSLADRAVRESVDRIVADHEGARIAEVRAVRSAKSLPRKAASR
ncbi:MAG TPA: LysR substrate-binding domain-containing protein [Acidimicrobiia bacterium]